MPRQAALLLAAVVTGCGGAGPVEWEGAQRDMARLRADLDAANKRHADDEQKYADAEAQIEDMKNKLRELGAAFQDSAHRHSETTAIPPPVPTVPSGWQQIGTRRGSCPAIVAVSFEGAGRVAETLGIRTAFVKIEYGSKKECPKENFKLVILHTRFDCNLRAFEILDVMDVDWHDKRTDTPGDGSGARTQFPDDTLGDLQWKFVCGTR